MAQQIKLKLMSFSNVFPLGYKKFEVLQIILIIAIYIVPYNEKNIHIQYSTPTKFLDYLASGLPVVSTNFVMLKTIRI